MRRQPTASPFAPGIDNVTACASPCSTAHFLSFNRSLYRLAQAASTCALPATRRNAFRARRAVLVASAPASAALCCAAKTAGIALLANIALLGTVKAKGFDASGLVDTLTLRKGVKASAVDLNRALSTAALTVMGLAYLPGFEAQRIDLLKMAMVSVWVHATASFALGRAAQFPDLMPPKAAQTRQLAGLALGGMANGFLVMTNFGVSPLAASPLPLCILLLAASTAHAITFNAVAFKTAFRPVGVVSFLAAVLAIGCVAAGTVTVA